MEYIKLYEEYNEDDLDTELSDIMIYLIDDGFVYNGYSKGTSIEIPDDHLVDLSRIDMMNWSRYKSLNVKIKSNNSGGTSISSFNELNTVVELIESIYDVTLVNIFAYLKDKVSFQFFKNVNIMSEILSKDIKINRIELMFRMED